MSKSLNGTSSEDNSPRAFFFLANPMDAADRFLPTSSNTLLFAAARAGLTLSCTDEFMELVLLSEEAMPTAILSGCESAWVVLSVAEGCGRESAEGGSVEAAGFEAAAMAPVL